MSEFIVAPEAEADLRRIWRYLLGEAGLATANRIQGELLDSFEGLAESPGQGASAYRSDEPRRAFFQLLSVHDRVPEVGEG